MWGYLSKRVIQMAFTFLLFRAATYFIIDAQPGDIADLLANNPDIPPIERQRLRAELGLDKPPIERFATYMTNFYQGNLGVSFREYPRPVSEIIIERLPRTLVLFVTASIVAGWAGFVTGKILAWKRGGWIEHGSTIVGVTLYTVFTPWFGLMMIWLFAVQLDLLPTGKFLDPIKMAGYGRFCKCNLHFFDFHREHCCGTGFARVHSLESRAAPLSPSNQIRKRCCCAGWACFVLDLNRKRSICLGHREPYDPAGDDRHPHRIWGLYVADADKHARDAQGGLHPDRACERGCRQK